jgi:cyanophycin synthetase
MVCLSQAHLLNRRLRRRGTGTRAADRQRSVFYERIWCEAAAAIEAMIEPLGDGLFEITRDAARVRVCRNLCPVDDALTLSIAGNKPLVHRLLASEGLATPPHAEFTLARIGCAVEFLKCTSGPCVVKPARDTGAGHGVTTGVTDRNSLARAAALAASYGEALLIEQQIPGANYRLLYLDGTLLDAVLRKPPTVIGDGRASVRTLVDLANEVRLAKGASNAQFLLTIDLDMRKTLASHGLALSSIPARGAVVKLKTAVNENRGLDNETATDSISQSIIADGARAAAAVGSRLAGVDVITIDPTIPLAESGGVICEVNTTPGLYYHYHKADGPTPVAVEILEWLLCSAKLSVRVRRQADNLAPVADRNRECSVPSTQYSVRSTQNSELSAQYLEPNSQDSVPLDASVA